MITAAGDERNVLVSVQEVRPDRDQSTALMSDVWVGVWGTVKTLCYLWRLRSGSCFWLQRLLCIFSNGKLWRGSLPHGAGSLDQDIQSLFILQSIYTKWICRYRQYLKKEAETIMCFCRFLVFRSCNFFCLDHEKSDFSLKNVKTLFRQYFNLSILMSWKEKHQINSWVLQSLCSLIVHLAPRVVVVPKCTVMPKHIDSYMHADEVQTDSLSALHNFTVHHSMRLKKTVITWDYTF